MAAALPAATSDPLIRAVAPYSSLPELSAPFLIDPAQRSYSHQYSNIYFVRLVELRPVVEDHAQEKWKKVRAPLLPRILNIQKGQVCYIVGTVYMDMPLKPNVLDDMARSFYSSQDAVHLEDESGRVRLVGPVIQKERDREGGGLVTGVIMAALGRESGNGDFEVIDVCFAGLPSLYKKPSNGIPAGKEHAHAMDVDDASERTWVALASGLSIGTETAALDFKAQLLAEWLMGEVGGPADQLQAARITRLVLAGNSLAQPSHDDDCKPRRFNHPNKGKSDSHPTKAFSVLVSDLLSTSLPVNLVPGPDDPAGAIMPQQPMPKVMFGGKKMEGLESMTNPTWMEVGERSFVCTGGQNIDDLYKYLPAKGRLDTLWVYPFPDTDPFVIAHRPDVYVIGNQPEFETAIVGGPEAPTRIVLLPSFAVTGTVALLCLDTLEVKTVTFEVPAWVGEASKEEKTEL